MVTLRLRLLGYSVVLRRIGVAAIVLAASFSCAALAAPDVRRVERGNLVTEGIPDAPLSLRERLRMYQAARGAEFQDFSPDGRGILISTRFGETSQLHRVEAPIALRRQITFYDEPVNFAMYRPGKWPKRTILFSRDTGGDELYQLYLLDDRNGDLVRLTDGKSRNTDPVFSQDGKWVAWTSMPSEFARSRVMVADASDPKTARAVLEEDGNWTSAVFSPDAQTLVVTRENSISDQQIWLVDLTNGRKSQVKPSPVKIWRGSPVFAPDGRSLIYISDEDSEFRRVVRYDLRTDDEDPLTGDLPRDVETLVVAPNGRTAVISVNEAGTSQLYTLDTKRGRAVPGPKVAPGEIEGMRFSSDSRRLGFTLNGTAGRDAYVWDFGKRGPVQWTDSEVGGLDKAEFVAPQIAEYDTFDDVDGKKRRISAFVYRPKVQAKAPVLILLHGGPEAQFRPSFNPFIQYLVQELKVAVVAPNVRGSTGYGKYFVDLDNGPRRVDAVKDVGATLAWIAAQNDFEPRRVAVYGGSYGGYLAYATMADYSDRVTAGISIVGISNFATFLNNTSGYQRDLRRAEYGDERDPRMRETLDKISPLMNVARIKKPVLIIQGANDPRVPATEATQMLKAVRANGAEAWYMLAKDEGHGFQRKSNRDAQNAAIAAFLKLKLLGQRLE